MPFHQPRIRPEHSRSFTRLDRILSDFELALKLSSGTTSGGVRTEARQFMRLRLFGAHASALRVGEINVA